MVRLPRNEKQTHRLNFRLQMWPSDLTLALTLTLNFQGQIWNLLYLNQKWYDCHETKSKHIDLNSRPQIWQWVWPWPSPWYLNFQGHMWSWPFGDQGVRIYQIVTGVTSIVGVPSTHLVDQDFNDCQYLQLNISKCFSILLFGLIIKMTLMDLMNTVVFSVHQQCRYCSLALHHPNNPFGHPYITHMICTKLVRTYI